VNSSWFNNVRDAFVLAQIIRAIHEPVQLTKPQQLEDLHADKTANATILIEKQRWVYKQYKFYTQQLQRAFGLIQDEDERKLSVTGTCRATLTRRRCFSSGMVLVTVQFGERLLKVQRAWPTRLSSWDFLSKILRIFESIQRAATLRFD